MRRWTEQGKERAVWEGEKEDGRSQVPVKDLVTLFEANRTEKLLDNSIISLLIICKITF